MKLNSHEFNNLEQKVGQFIEYWGFKSIEGKIWLNIFLSKQELCAEDFIEKFGISKALVSNSINRLLEYNVILKSNKGMHGKQYFKANTDITKVIADVLRMREKRMIGQIETDAKLLLESEQESDNLNTQRIAYIINMTSTANDILNLLLFQSQELSTSLFFGKAPENE